jgi:hypothetical protein
VSAFLPRWAAAATATTKKATKTTKKATRTTKKVTTTKATTTTKPVNGATSARGTFDAGHELVVSFSYAAAGGGFGVKNPYIAVFVTDDAGALVRTIDLSIQLSGKGLRYINELRYWYSLDQDRLAGGGQDLVETISSPTRLPGSYKVAWDGRDERKALVPLGAYVLCIEASREHGPYELITQPIVLDGKTFSDRPADSGELQRVALELRTRS